MTIKERKRSKNCHVVNCDYVCKWINCVDENRKCQHVILQPPSKFKTEVNMIKETSEYMYIFSDFLYT